MRHGRWTIAAALLGVGLSVAQGAQHIVDIAWGADGSFRHATHVAPGRFAEVCGALPAGASVRWRFEASAPVDFNIHYHVGKDVVYPAKAGAQTQAADRLDATVAQDYCWMWTNRGSNPVRLSVELSR